MNQSVLDFLAQMNVNPAILISISGILDFVKKRDPERKHKQHYWKIQLALCFLVGVLTLDLTQFSHSMGPLQIMQLVLMTLTNVFVYFGFSMIIYLYGFKMIEAIREKMLK